MNPLFESYRNSTDTNSVNIGQSNQGFNFNVALQNLAQQIMPTGMTPEQIVRQKIQNGEMTQQQFEQFSRIADRITGRKR